MQRATRRSATATMLAIAATMAALAAQGPPLSTAEAFALADDRAKVVASLVPGTDDWYWWRCLERLGARDFATVRELLPAWIRAYGKNARTTEIETRVALMSFADDPARTFTFLRERLDLTFDQTPVVPGATADLPTRLDPALLDPATLTRRALQERPGTVDGFDDGALPALAQGALDADTLHSLVERLDRPDVPNLPALVVRDLDHPQSGGFGSNRVHRELRLAQLEECARLRPALLREPKFVEAMLTRLAPAEPGWQDDPRRRGAQLQRLLTFADRLGPSFGSLAAHVHVHWLRHGLSQGSPDRDRFLAYLRLPRRGTFAARATDRAAELVEADLAKTGLAPVDDDAAVVRACLEHFFATENDVAPFAEVLDADTVKRVFAETKLLLGQGDGARWTAMLPAESVAEIERRVEILFPADAPDRFAEDATVGLDVLVKNTPTLLVRVYAIDAYRWHQEKQRDVDPAIDLDGVAPTHEETHRFDEAPVRRVRRHFDLPMMQGPGTWIVEFVGNGTSARAVVQKGRLRHTERTSAAGHVFRILDDTGMALRDAVLWFGGREYTPDERGEVLVPFTTESGRKAVVLRHGNLSTLATFAHVPETMSLECRAFVDRESLIAGADAKLLVRPTLLVAGQPASLGILRDAALVVTGTDLDGKVSPLEVPNPALRDDRETEHTFHVPPRLAAVSVSLRGIVKNLAGTDVALTSSPVTFAVNGMDATPATTSGMVLRTPSGFVYEVRGKNGEPRPGTVCTFEIHLRDYRVAVKPTLQTDARGRIDLGPLPGVIGFRVACAGAPDAALTLDTRSVELPETLCGRVGDVLRVPWLGAAKAPSRDEVSLLGNEADEFGRLSVTDGFLELRDLPAGDYVLRLHRLGASIPVRMLAGERRDGWIVDERGATPASNPQPIHLRGIEVDGTDLVVRVANASADTRVHVVATRAVPTFDPFAQLRGDAAPPAAATSTPSPRVGYHEARGLGDERRYVLERRFAAKFPGNMLQRPSLLVNPWALDRSTTENEAPETTAWNSALGESGGRGSAHGGRGARFALQLHPGTFANLDWLPRSSSLAANLVPNRSGVVRVPLASLGAGSLIHVLALDGEQAVQDVLVRDETPLEPRARTLARSFDPASPMRQKKAIEFVDAGATIDLGDATASQSDVFDTLGHVHRAFLAATGDPALAEFSFLLRWPSCDTAKKRELYGRFACHELNFFLFHKDAEFFAAAVKPLLASKLHKTFLDQWLLGDDLRSWLEPWSFAQLNLIEKVLLAQRLGGDDRRTIETSVREAVEMRPRSAQDLDGLFDAALQSGAIAVYAGVGGVDELGVGRLLDLNGFGQIEADRPAAPVAGGGGGDKGGADTKRKADADDDGLPKTESAFDSNQWNSALGLGGDARRRGEAKQLYRAVNPTKLFVEHAYWHRRLEQMTPDAVAANRFWLDYATAPAGRPFAPSSVMEATGSALEMLMALAVLDLPFEAGKHEVKADGDRRTLRAATPLLLVRKETTKTDATADGAPLLLGENFFRLDDRFRFVDGERRDAFVTDEFLVDVAYGCQVVVTNPTSSKRTTELLLQIPAGAIPVQKGFWTRGVPVELQPYATATVEYAFYFPAVGDFAHYPVHAAEKGKLAAHADARTLHVVATPSKVDTTSWEHVSQQGTADEVFAHLDAANVLRLDLSRLAWRMKDRAFFAAILPKLRARHAYDDTLWSFGILHQDQDVAREYLRHADGFLAACGMAIESPLVTIDPVERRAYQHLELDPLVHQRAHVLGGKRVLGNQDLARQYASLMTLLGYHGKLDSTDWTAVTYYLLLQDRVEEALATFAKIDPAQIATRIQYDYLQAYLCFFTADTGKARAIAEKYKDHPVPHWQKRFADVLAQLDEAEGRTAPATGEPTADQLAATAPALEVALDGHTVKLAYKNLGQCEVRYYELDVEFAFSAQPFAGDRGTTAAFVRPSLQAVQALPADKPEIAFELPAQFHRKNVLVEVRGQGLVRSQTHFANALAVRFLESWGQVAVAEPGSDKPLPKAYVKVFAKMPDGSVRFHKDGYTDLRGRFDYASVSDDPDAGATRYAVLVLDEQRGAVIREVAPPTK